MLSVRDLLINPIETPMQFREFIISTAGETEGCDICIRVTLRMFAIIPKHETAHLLSIFYRKKFYIEIINETIICSQLITIGFNEETLSFHFIFGNIFRLNFKSMYQVCYYQFERKI